MKEVLVFWGNWGISKDGLDPNVKPSIKFSLFKALKHSVGQLSEEDQFADNNEKKRPSARYKRQRRETTPRLTKKNV